MKRNVAGVNVCKSKKRFHNKYSASERSKEIKQEGGVKLNYYFCPVCSGWNLTSKTKESSRKIRKYLKSSQERLDIDYENQIQREADYWIKNKNW